MVPWQKRLRQEPVEEVAKSIYMVIITVYSIQYTNNSIKEESLSGKANDKAPLDNFSMSLKNYKNLRFNCSQI